jgi:hypothetical protein
MIITVASAYAPAPTRGWGPPGVIRRRDQLRRQGSEGAELSRDVGRYDASR